MTELSFLLDLLLNHKIQKVTQDAIRERIKEIELGQVQPVRRNHPNVIDTTVTPLQMQTAMNPARITGGVVDTGPGLKGPRKF